MVIQVLSRSSRLIAYGFLLLCGCTTHTAAPEPLAPENRAGEPLADARPLGSEQPNSVEHTEPTGPLALKDILALVLTRNKELSAFAWETRAAEAAILQAGMLPNPVLTVELEDAFGTDEFSGTKQSQTTIQINELIELGGKRAARMEVASRTKDLSNSEYEKARLKVLSEASDKFHEVVAHQELIRLVNEAASLARSNQAAISRRVEAGSSSIVDEKRANITLAKTRIAAEHAEHELASARKELASFWGSSSDEFAELQSNLFAVPALPRLETLESKLSSHPETEVWLNDEKLRRAELALAQSKAVPDIVLGAGVRHYENSSDQALLFQLSVPLPLFDTNQGGVAEGLARIEKSRADSLSFQSRLKAVLFGLYQSIQHKQLELRILSNEIIPDAQAALRAAQEGFERGSFSHLELADAQNTFLESREAQIRVAVAYRHLMIELGRLTGETINE